MHLHTIFKVKAGSAEDAVAIVNGVLEDDNYERGAFDYYDEDSTAVITMTEEEFQARRQKELQEYDEYLQKALKLPDDNDSKGYYLRMAGESIDPERWATWQRLVYDYCAYQQDDENVGTIFFVTTDRHY